jgi:hypothetical protein
LWNDWLFLLYLSSKTAQNFHASLTSKPLKINLNKVDFSRSGSSALEQSSFLSALSAFIEIPATVQHKKSLQRFEKF